MKQAPIYNNLGKEHTEVASPQVLVGQIKNITTRSVDLKPLLTIKLKDGSVHHNVETINVGSGTGLGYVHFPVEIGGFVYCLKTYENSPIVCIGGALKPNDLPIELSESVASVNSDRKANNAKDLLLYNDGSKVNLSYSNGLVLDSDKMIRMQLGENAVLRMSRYGKAGDNILDGSQFIDILFAYIATLEEKLNQHSEWIKNASPIVNQQFTAAAAEHTAQALIYTNAGDPVNAALETQEATNDTESAGKALTLGQTAGEPLATTTATAKSAARDALNPYVQTPYKQ